jgi:hypothetical protein
MTSAPAQGMSGSIAITIAFSFDNLQIENRPGA